MSTGYFKTKKEAEAKAARLRKLKLVKRPVRVIKRDIGWDVVVPK